ncbi:protein of unknown function [Reichenbachiella faecimaris]|uniref:DUF4153 domain-containing protein n=1 Tax=Reichenbachiella faecimaris TaxID=692418 RepID=A0A1W2GE84_REIFA|nr:DUF4153 domain-containing protein [Reichenbachiella faecimaris]SMD34566.1 protein of unknown function [Reichenbachiella faecimaris]
MNLASINYLFRSAKGSLLRFPITLLSALCAVCLSIYLVEYEDEISNYFPFINGLITFALGIPLFFCVSIISSKKGIDSSFKIGAHIVAGFILLGIYLSLPNAEHTHNTSIPYIRYGIFNIIVHLLVSFSPYVNGKKLNGFWNFNKTLFIRILTSILYSGFLYVGLVLALTALKLLFDIEIHDELYFELFIVIIGLFNTWFFLSGIPSDLEVLDNEREYPNGLKVFAQYVLLPLLVLYLIILYAYGSKITIFWDWPKGIVSYLISCVSVLGILTVLLFYPYGELKENGWIKKSTSAFYLLLFPLIALLFFAIAMRISDYGITINRYVIVLLGIWLAIVATYFTVGRTNIKFIPMSLAVTLGLMSFGPWGMFIISEKSQAKRLVTILNDNHLLKDGKVVNEVVWEADSLPNWFYSKKEGTNKGVLSDSLHNEVYSIVNYLDDYHGLASIRPIYQQNLDSLIVLSLDSNKYRNEAEIYMRSMGLSYSYKYINSSDAYFGYSIETTDVMALDEFDYLTRVNLYNYQGKEAIRAITIDESSCQILLNSGNSLGLFFIGQNDTIDFAFTEKIGELIQTHGKVSETNLDPSNMTLEASSNEFKLKFIINHLQLEDINDTLKATSLDGDLLLKRRK